MFHCEHVVPLDHLSENLKTVRKKTRVLGEMILRQLFVNNACGMSGHKTKIGKSQYYCHYRVAQ